MQQRAGLLFLSKKTSRVFLILQDERWTVPTFARISTVLEDSKELLDNYSDGRIIPIELYLSEDRGFEYSTYICLVESEFFGNMEETICWANLDLLPKNLHTGLKTTLNNSLIRAKIETIMVLENDSKISK